MTKTLTPPAEMKTIGLVEPDQSRQVQVSLQTRALENSELDVEFVISNFSLDSYGTRFDPKGCNLTQFRKNPIITYRHMRDGGIYSLPIGRGLVGATFNGVKDPDTFHMDAAGNLRMTVRFTPKEVFEFGYQICQLVKNNFMNMGSIGADPTKEEIITERDGKRVIVFREWMLYEFAIVPIGSNNDALVTQRAKDLNISREDIIEKEGEADEAAKAVEADEARLMQIVTLLRDEKTNEEDKADKAEPEVEDEGEPSDMKVEAECWSDDKGTYVNVKLKREKDGQVTEMVHRNVITITETKEQARNRRYYEEHSKALKEYRELMDSMYKLCGVKQPENEIDAVRGLETLFELASTVSSQRERPAEVPEVKLTDTQLRNLGSQLALRVVTNVRAALEAGHPIRDLDGLIQSETEKALSIQ